MKIISVMAVEGGVGVTSRAIDLATKTVEEGQRVLVVDTTQTKQMATLMQQHGFHFLDDVRQLFKPLEQARWRMERMPQLGLLCLPEARPWFRSSVGNDEGAMVFCNEIVQKNNATAHDNLRAALADLAPHFDCMIVDVENKYQMLMSHFYMVSDDVQFMRRIDEETGEASVDLEQFLDCQRRRPKVAKIDYQWTRPRDHGQQIQRVSC